ncbi:hypothetical protein BCV69DRAFT_169722 [Microstroma glucosiphilum]|uniref:ARM repeat-containing protein n=1 Tax=Pseudomicrostroma glucosiphilum TaxID=1684307 RepID=A0A316U9A4_9BASI|nr:hypothetical protein BCV69DRAFT_169722 [Pseudomicrostroma glucosiphilum]PWN21418.1 hypothetical protein BCV69DRAFT_169722 [Pseudomicrostroma glucosiphilum]
MPGSSAATSSGQGGEASQQQKQSSGATGNSSRPPSAYERRASQQDTNASAGPSQPSALPPFSKRARQIQEESGVNLPVAAPVSPRSSVSGGHYRPPALRESASFTLESLNEILRPVQHPQGNRHSISTLSQPATKGRDRAGTLPSSWSGQGEQLLPARPRERLGSDFQPTSRSGNSSPLLSGEAGDGGAAAFGDGLPKRLGSIGSIPTLGNFGRRQTAGPSTLSLASSANDVPSETSAELPARLRTASLASGLTSSDPFASGIFSSPTSAWPDRTRAQSTQLTGRHMQELRGRGATIANPSSVAADKAYHLDAAANSLEQNRIMMDNLGLSEPRAADTEVYSGVGGGSISGASGAVGANRYSISSSVSSSAGRDRATTLAAATARPKFDSSTRGRSSSFAPNQIFGNYSIDEESAVPTSNVRSGQDAVSPLLTFAQHGGLANNALQQRLSLETAGGRQVGRGRATSLSVLNDAGSHHPASVRNEGSLHQYRPTEQQQTYTSEYGSGYGMAPSPSTQGFFSDVVTQEALYAWAAEHKLDPVAFAEVAAASGVLVAPSSAATDQEEFARSAATTRLRAGTVAVLPSGASSRMRAEQELMRLAGAGPPASEGDLSFQQLYPRPFASSSSPVKAAALDNHVRERGSPEKVPNAVHQATSRSHNHQQPTRSLWIGNLDVSTTGQELMQAFAPYGAIESLRLLPEKECGFVNYVETADAVRAREDVLHRLGGKIKPNGTGPNGTVRIGFGKIDSAPDSTAHGNSGVTSPRGGKFRPISPSDGASLTPGGGERDESLPTRALWIGSIPSTTTPATLLSIFQPYGPIESARVLTHKNCGFINFERVDDAVRARKMLNGRDVLGAEVGSVRVGFAKVPSKPADDAFPGEPSSEGYASAVDSLDRLKGASGVPAERQAIASNLDNYRSPLVTDLLSNKHVQQQNLLDEQHLAGGMPAPPGVSALALSHTRSASHSGLSASNSIVPSSDKGGVPLPAELQPRPSVTDLQLLMEDLSTQDTDEERESHLTAVRQFRPPATYYTSIPLVSEINNPRRFDSTKLRDMRKGIESGQYSQADIDNIASSFLESIVDLASDYIGNTVVQKFFEKCSEPIKTALLQRIAPHLAMIGIHKNGTWSAQKIIDTAQTPEQRSLIAQHLRPYIPPLLLDQFGNYVVQCLLPYGSFAEAGEQRTGSDFIIDAMTDRCWEIAQGRFGARSMRACLESPKVTRLQCKRVAIAIILNSVPLATSPNGSLLLTWLLDASELPGRFRLLAPRFMPHLTHLCTHKLASLTVLRVVNQNAEPEAASRIMGALFESPNDATLEEILTDQVHGSQFITKVLQSPHIDLSRRDGYCEQVKRIVREHRLTSVPAYRKLVEDLGLPFQPSGPHMFGNGNGAQHSGGVPVVRAGYPIATSPHTSHASQHSMSGIANGLTGYPTSTAPRYGSHQQQYSSTAYSHPAQSPQAPPRHFGQHDPQFRDAFNPWPSMSSSPASTGGYNTGSPTPPIRMGGRSPAKTPPTQGGSGGPGGSAAAGRGGYVATPGY